jgi:DNA uptake protein ComE-like DNA-binding protein
MKPILRDYIYFTRSQRKALLIISIFIALLFAFNQTAHLIFEEEIEFELDFLEVKLQDLQKEESHLLLADPKDREDFSSNVRLFPFDPNQISRTEWQQMGLSESQANSILKYREKGGSFKVKSDLKKMYVVSDELFRKWESYIQLPDHLPDPKADKDYLNKSKRKNKAIILDLNLADSSDFTELRGIGPVYASRIVKFRNALGGFYSIDQLTEVWGLEDSVLIRLRAQLELNELSLTKLKINHLEASELKSHPYLNWQQANAIVNYRKQHGAYERIEDLQKIYLLSDSAIQRISPYLEFD